MKEKKIKKPKLVIFVTFLVLVLSLVQLFCSHRLATAGAAVAFYEEKTLTLQETNQRLDQEINQMGSLSKISLQAESLGLVRTSQVLHLTPQAPIALER